MRVIICRLSHILKILNLGMIPRFYDGLVSISVEIRTSTVVPRFRLRRVYCIGSMHKG